VVSPPGAFRGAFRETVLRIAGGTASSLFLKVSSEPRIPPVDIRKEGALPSFCPASPAHGTASVSSPPARQKQLLSQLPPPVIELVQLGTFFLFSSSALEKARSLDVFLKRHQLVSYPETRPSTGFTEFL